MLFRIVKFAKTSHFSKRANLEITIPCQLWDHNCKLYSLKCKNFWSKWNLSCAITFEKFEYNKGYMWTSTSECSVYLDYSHQNYDTTFCNTFCNNYWTDPDPKLGTSDTEPRTLDPGSRTWGTNFRSQDTRPGSKSQDQDPKTFFVTWKYSL